MTREGRSGGSLEFVRSEGCLVVITQRGRREVPLRPQERDLVVYMDEQNRRNGGVPTVCDHDELIRAVWGRSGFPGERKYLQHLICGLRKKLGRAAGKALVTESGQGYRLSCRSSASDDASAFLCGPPVFEPRRSFGRLRELSRISELWRSLPLQHAAIVGPKRSGKTTFLHLVKNVHTLSPELLREDQRRHRLHELGRCRFVFVDFQDPRMRVREKLLAHILRSLRLPVPSRFDLAGFVDLICARVDVPVVVLMDELDAALDSSELDGELWSALRSLSSNLTQGLVGFAVTLGASGAGRPRNDGPASSFLDMFGYTIHLGPLDADEARELLGSSPLPFSSKDVQWMLRESAGWPALLQILADTRLETLRADGSEWKEEALARIGPYRDLLGGGAG